MSTKATTASRCPCIRQHHLSPLPTLRHSFQRSMKSRPTWKPGEIFLCCCCLFYSESLPLSAEMQHCIVPNPICWLIPMPSHSILFPADMFPHLRHAAGFFGHTLHQEVPSIVRLAVHLENQQHVVFREDATPEEVLAKPSTSTLLAWFRANASDFSRPQISLSGFSSGLHF